MLLRTTVVVCMLGGKVASAQTHTDTIAALDTIVQHFSRIGREHGADMWPGFRPETIPVAFVLPTHGSVLFNWRGPLPEGYQPVSAIPGAGWRDEPALGAASTRTEASGRAIAQIVVSTLDPAELLPTTLHEAFHVFQHASVRPGRRFGRGENSFHVSSYPVFDVENESLFASEGRVLAAALSAPSMKRKRELARAFVAVRRARHRRLEDSFSQFDRATELNEGLAQYVLVRGLALMAGDTKLSTEWRSSARQRLVEHEKELGSVTRNITRSLRLRFYSTGAAQALLLDAIAGSGWKRKLMEENETLQDALAGSSGIDAAEHKAFLGAMRTIDSTRARADAAASVSRLIAMRAAQVDSLLSRPGILLELSASELPGKDFGICSFDPQNLLQVSPTLRLQTRMWRPCAGKALVSELNVPSVHDTQRGTFRAVIGTEADVHITVAGKPVTLADGQTIDAASDLRLDSPRANVQSARARISREGRTIRITPLP